MRFQIPHFSLAQAGCSRLTEVLVWRYRPLQAGLGIIINALPFLLLVRSSVSSGCLLQFGFRSFNFGSCDEHLSSKYLVGID